MSMDDAQHHGFDELAAKLEHPTWAYIPVQNLFTKWALFVQRRTVANMKRGKGGWVWKAETRQSVTREVDPSPLPQYARVGSNKAKFRWGEFGTGLLSEDPASSKKRHWPPAHALDKWAIEHGFDDGAQVARIIGMRGGLKPRRYLRTAFKDSQDQLPGWLKQAAGELQQLASQSVRT